MTSENGTMYMPVAPAYGAPNAGGFGLDGLGGGWGLLILLIILFGRGGFGNWGGNGDGNLLPLMMGNQNTVWMVHLMPEAVTATTDGI